MPESIDHWRHFADFCRWETAAGGPDPHMAIVGWLCRDEPWEGRVRWAGCYIGAYNAPMTQALAAHLPAPLLGEQATADWLRQRWPDVVLRRERRAVRTPPKLARYLMEYEAWSRQLAAAPWMSASGTPESRYEQAWRDCQRVYGIGRYVALKLLEFLRRYCGAPIELPDLRAKGGWSPRAGLALLYPSRAAALNGDDSPQNVQLADALAEEANMRLAFEHDVTLDRYTLQVLLCDYKQSYVGRRQYPGRSHDSELDYHERLHGPWGLGRGILDARLSLFPHEALGELHGWRKRDELGHVLADHGYTWSDLVYDYHASRENLAEPVPR